jgi:hypothetical protein
MTTRANLYVDQGIDYSIDLFLTTNDGEEYDATNKSFYCNIKKLYSSSISANAEITSHLSANTSMIELYIPPETSEALDPGKYTYDIIMVNGSGSRTKVLEGLMFILPTVTRL